MTTTVTTSFSTSVDEFMSGVIEGLVRNTHYGTARLYMSVQRVLRNYGPYQGLSFGKLDSAWLEGFETYLRLADKRRNTYSTYMRVLRAVCNRAVADGLAPYHPKMFSRVYTGTCCERKLALDRNQLRTLFLTEVADPVLCRVQKFCQLMFLLHGMPFVDLVYLRKRDYTQGRIIYYRRKTETRVEVPVGNDARKLIHRLADCSTSPFLFDFLSAVHHTPDELYADYRRCLRTFNGQLKRLSAVLGLGTPLTTYTIRHSWGTLAYHMEVHPGIISQAMGHSSVAVTETYLKPFVLEQIAKVNRAMFRAIKGGTPA